MPPNHQAFLYCPMCSASYSAPQIDRFHRHCHQCHYTYYENLRTSVGAIVIQNSRLLFLKRAVPPRINTFDFPRGFVDSQEHPKQALFREIEEELSVKAQVFKLLGAYGPNPYLYKQKYSYCCDLFYLVTLSSTKFVCHPEIASAHWLPMSNLPADKELAFPSTRQIVRDLQSGIYD